MYISLSYTPRSAKWSQSSQLKFCLHSLLPRVSYTSHLYDQDIIQYWTFGALILKQRLSQEVIVQESEKVVSDFVCMLLFS
jgi:hypothetical protein